MTIFLHDERAGQCAISEVPDPADHEHSPATNHLLAESSDG